MASQPQTSSSTGRKSSKKKSEETQVEAQQSSAAPQESHPRGPTQEQIAQRAYEIFLARGSQPGNSEQDWLQAERELRLGRY